jgi:hypothetical protein
VLARIPRALIRRRNDDEHRPFGEPADRKPRRPPVRVPGRREAAEAWRIGTEHEKFVYRHERPSRASWDEPGGIRDLLVGLTEFGWKPVEEGGKIIALTGPTERQPGARRASSSCRARRSGPAPELRRKRPAS